MRGSKIKKENQFLFHTHHTHREGKKKEGQKVKAQRREKQTRRLLPREMRTLIFFPANRKDG